MTPLIPQNKRDRKDAHQSPRPPKSPPALLLASGGLDGGWRSGWPSGAPGAPSPPMPGAPRPPNPGAPPPPPGAAPRPPRPPPPQDHSTDAESPLVARRPPRSGGWKTASRDELSPVCADRAGTGAAARSGAAGPGRGPGGARAAPAACCAPAAAWRAAWRSRRRSRADGRASSRTGGPGALLGDACAERRPLPGLEAGDRLGGVGGSLAGDNDGANRAGEAEPPRRAGWFLDLPEDGGVGGDCGVWRLFLDGGGVCGLAASRAASAAFSAAFLGAS